MPPLLTLAAAGCPDCAPGSAARAEIWADPNLYTYVALSLAPFVVVAAGWALQGRGRADREVVSAGLLLLGVGLGGFIDGIALHQLLQWHNMLSSWIPPDDLVEMKINMVWDGVFHGFTWSMTALGVAQLWRAGPRRGVPWVTRSFVGALLSGWGLFNAIEGLIDHQILGVHHVHPGRGELAWDLGFIGLGVALVGAGAALLRSGRRAVSLVPERENGG